MTALRRFLTVGALGESSVETVVVVVAAAAAVVFFFFLLDRADIGVGGSLFPKSSRILTCPVFRLATVAQLTTLLRAVAGVFTSSVASVVQLCS